MDFYITEWADKSAALISREGHHLCTFKDVDSALVACGEKYGITANHVIPHFHSGQNPIRFRHQQQSAAA